MAAVADKLYLSKCGSVALRHSDSGACGHLKPPGRLGPPGHHAKLTFTCVRGPVQTPLNLERNPGQAGRVTVICTLLNT